MQLRRLVSMGALALLCGCAGGEGGDSAGQNVPVGTDMPLFSATRSVLDGGSDLGVASDILHREIARLLADIADPVQGHTAVVRSVLAAVRSREDLETLRLLSLSVNGRVFTSRPALAPLAQGTEGQSANRLVVYYINGVWNGLISALASLEVLRDSVAASISPADVRLLYNSSGLDRNEVHCAEVGSKLSLLDPEEAKRIAKEEDRCGTGFASLFDFLEALGQLIPEALLPLLQLPTDPDLVRLYADEVKKDLQRGKAVILVAHSQGNFYARDLVKLLNTEAPSAPVGVIMVGSPVFPGVLENLLGEDRVRVVNNGLDPVAFIGDPLCLKGCTRSPVSSFNPFAHHRLVSSYLEKTGEPRALFEVWLKELADTLMKPPEEDAAFSDDFDGETTGAEPSKWTALYNEGFLTREEAAAAGAGLAIDDQIYHGKSGKSLRLFDTGGASAAIAKELPPSTIYEVEFAIRIEEGNDDVINVNLRGTNLSEGVLLVLWAGDVRLRLGATGDGSDAFIGTYQEGVWHKYRILVDTETDFVTIWQDGNQLGAPRKIEGPGISDPLDVDLLRVTTKNGSTGTAWLDDVVVR